METMKIDMGGAASILATMKAIARLKPKINVVAAIPSAENMPGGAAQKPGDVIRHYGGTTSEVLNTDAEGRLILADALALLAEKKPSCIVDTATLTGACMVALGTDITGAMGNDDALVDEIVKAGRVDRGLDLAAPAAQGVPAPDRLEHRRHQEHRRPMGRGDHGRVVPRGVRGRCSLGAPRHRRPGLLREGQRPGPEGRDGRPRARARPVRARPGGVSRDEPAPRTGPVLGVFAHPDDAEICAGGVLAKWAAAGREVHLLILTNGDRGSQDPALDRA